MKQKIISLILSLALALSLTASAMAAGVEEQFPAVNPYPGYADVADGAWYADAVRVCYETGLMNGTNADSFSPESAMNVAQAVTLAVRIHDILSGGDGDVTSPAGHPWHAVAVARGRELATAAGEVRLLSRLADPDSPATRADFFGFMALAADDGLLTPINSITLLPDTEDPRVLAFYNAGILKGIGAYGSFKGGLTLRRCEAAEMSARLVRPALRQSFTLAPVPLLCRAAGVLPETVFFQGSQTVTALEYLTRAEDLILGLEEACAAQGLEFNWTNTVDGQSFLDYVKEGALSALGVTRDMGTDAWKSLDLQVFYSRYLDLST